VGRKLFACRRSPDVFAYSGEVLFPSLVLGQIVEAADCGVLMSSDDPSARHRSFANAVRGSFAVRRVPPSTSFEILHASRASFGMTATFRVWKLSFDFSSRSWKDEEASVPMKESALIVTLGSGESAFRSQIATHLQTSQGRTSRATFWAFCDALRQANDPFTGGAPQLVGIYRTGEPKVFGIIYQGQRFFQGLSLEGSDQFDMVEWRDELFQRVDGGSKLLISGAQRHGRGN
jgi:hypothetical protein